ncbi:MAG: DUF4345 domain-containing protein [Hydrogenophaga sp.]
MNAVKQFLLASGILVIFIGLLYGVAPKFVLEGVIGLSVQDNELHIFRAMMGLYGGMGVLLIMGSRYSQYVRPALVLETVFLGGLAGGRLVSLLADGHFHWFALLALSIELPMFFLCLFLLKKQRGSPSRSDSVGV